MVFPVTIKYLHPFSLYFTAPGSLALHQQILAWWSAYTFAGSDGEGARSPMKILTLAWLWGGDALLEPPYGLAVEVRRRGAPSWPLPGERGAREWLARVPGYGAS